MLSNVACMWVCIHFNPTDVKRTLSVPHMSINCAAGPRFTETFVRQGTMPSCLEDRVGWTPSDLSDIRSETMTFQGRNRVINLWAVTHVSYTP